MVLMTIIIIIGQTRLFDYFPLINGNETVIMACINELKFIQTFTFKF